MKNPRTKVLGIIVAGLTLVSLLTGCNATLGEGSSDPSSSPSASPSASASASAGPEVIDLSIKANVDSLCGDEAKEMLEYVETATHAKANSDTRAALKEYGIDNPKNTIKLNELVGELEVRANTDCGNVVPASAVEDGTVGVQNVDGSITPNLQAVNGTPGATLLMDSTTQPATPPLLDGSLRFTAQTLTWAGLVQRVGDQQWYIDGVNARAAQTGFTWDDVLKFASANYMTNGEIDGVNALAIQVFNRPDLTVEQARAEVSKYITPEMEKSLNITVNDKIVDGKVVPGIPVQYINDGFVNTRNVGSAGNPKMGDYFDNELMVRVTLMPITFDANGVPVSLDASRGAGVFIDCGNLHWVPVAVWRCTGAACVKPVCPPGTTGVPPNCIVPPKMCPWNPSLPVDSPNCLQPKGNRTPYNGWTPLGAGPLTTGQLSADQQASGEVRGNVTDNPVAAGTKSGDTTPDLPAGIVTAPGATPNKGADGKPVEDTSDDVVDPVHTNQDDGGTHGDTCIADPDTGVSNCG